MSDPLEAADQAWHDAMVLSHHQGRHVVRAWLRAAIGCPQCGGTMESVATCVQCEEPWGDKESCCCPEAWSAMKPGCPAEHVEISFLGETIWADPDRCIWVCEVDVIGVSYEHPRCFTYAGKPSKRHPRCGWQPRWSAITGGDDGD